MSQNLYKIFPRVALASAFPATTNLLATSITCANQYTESACRVEVHAPSAVAISLITTGPFATAYGSAMLLPKTGSVALTANTLYTLHHEMRNDRTYNYQLSASIAGILNMVVDEITEGLFYT